MTPQDPQAPGAPDVSDLLLARYRLGELPAAEAEALAARLGPAEHARLAAWAAEDEALLAQHPPAQVAAEVARRAGAAQAERRDRAFGWLTGRGLVGAGLALSAAAAAVLAWGGLGQAPTPDGAGLAGPAPIAAADPGVRAKGDARLLVFRNAGAEPELLLDGAPAKPGDAIQLGLIADGAAHGLIVSLDGRGTVTRHWPEVGAADAALAEGRVVLDFSYVLDDAPAFERFVLVTAPTPVDAPVVIQALAALVGQPDADVTPLTLPEGWRQTSITLRKPEVK